MSNIASTNRKSRLRYLGAAMALAIACWFSEILIPLDVVAWFTQSKLGQKEVSGEIVFVKLPDNSLNVAQTRNDIVQAIKVLNAGGAKEIYLDAVGPATTIYPRDESFKDAITNAKKLFTVGRYISVNDKATLRFLPEYLTGATPRTITKQWVDPFGIVWSVPKSVRVQNVSVPTFAARLAGDTISTVDEAQIDYRFSPKSIPIISLHDLSKGLVEQSEISGRRFVLGNAAGNSGSSNLPGSQFLPISYTSIIAAETIAAGGLIEVDAGLPLAILGLMLLLAVFVQKKYRTSIYFCAGLCVLATLIMPIFFDIRITSSPVLGFALVYVIGGALRRWRANVGYISDTTGLPSLQKMEADFAGKETAAIGAIVVAKIHNLSSVLASLPDEEHILYFNEISKRLMLTNKERIIYSDTGEYLIWSEAIETQSSLASHLLGLRSLFNTAVKVGSRDIDVALTFGVDLNLEAKREKRVLTARQAADQTDLAYKPVIFIETFDEAEEQWKISLQSKIDLALSNQEIFPVFQPKVDLKTNQVVGYEVLARWEDPERGFVSPKYFIEQCERAGRIRALTEFMVRTAISEFMASSVYNEGGSLSVNVSSILLSDMAISFMIFEILELKAFPAERLIIEVTETARIDDMQKTVNVLIALKERGIRLSLDDFGTGSAGLETFHRLPFQEIKIDRAFVKAALDDAKAMAIVEQSIKLAQSVGINVVCEGIENQETLSFLRTIGCNIGQGFFLGQPASLRAKRSTLKQVG